MKVVIVVLLLVLGNSPPVLAGDLPEQPQRGSLSLGAEFSSGHYGTDVTTRTLYLPLVVTWLPNDRLDLGVELPFIYQSSSAVTTTLYRSGQLMTTAQAAGMGGPGGNQQQQAGALATTLASTSTSSSSVSGLGDIILTLGVIAFFEEGAVPQLRPSFFLKCPTAKSSNGLGTGAYDAGLGLEASKWVGSMLLSGEGFYVWQGRVDGFGLKDYASFNGGVGYQLTDKLRPQLLIKGATAPSTYSGPLLEARVRVVYLLSGRTALDLYVAQGMAASSPDFGGGMTVSYSF